ENNSNEQNQSNTSNSESDDTKNDSTENKNNNSSENKPNVNEQSNSFIFMDDIKEITTSRNTMFIVKNDGTAYATGNNSSGQL
ncbi:RCC1 domain-containing protein, partial [Clostridioides difficile]|uniref:RCC1 domain-containing protein n=1 Tax=Clostridioides difficile TaxID=1496 RepID=UPI001F2847B9